MTGRRTTRLRLVHDTGRVRAARLHCTRTYGLTATELRAEMRRLTSRGWLLWEITRRFGCDCTGKDSSE